MIYYKFTRCFAGGLHFALLSDNRKDLFMQGFNDYGQLGLPKKDVSYFTPDFRKVCIGPDTEVQNVSLGGFHSLLICS